MKRKYLYPVLTVIIVVALYFAEKYVDQQQEDYPDTASVSDQFNGTEFNDNYLPSSSTAAIVKHRYFTLSYAEAHEQAEWVAYELSKNQLSNIDRERPYFVEDRSVKTKSADWRNYKNSGYDRGHLCPAADRRFSEEAYHETFLTSNISPQNHDFNAGVWNRLEQKVRYWAEAYDGVYVITGSVLKEGLKTIGDEQVSVPEHFYKVIIDKSNGEYRGIAFLIPNEPTNKSFFDFVVTIDTVERKSGIDFFSNLSETDEVRLESGIDLKTWYKK